MDEGSRSGGELIEGLKNGSMDSLRTIYERHRKGLYGFLYHLLGSHESAEDCLQDFFVHLHRKAPLYRGDVPFENWLYKMAKNIAFDYLRKAKIRSAVSIDQVTGDEEESGVSIHNLLSSPADSVEKAVLSAEAETLLRNAMLKLNEKDRQLITLCDIQGMSYRRAGEVMGYGEDTISTKLYRARKRLAKILKLKGEENV